MKLSKCLAPGKAVAESEERLMQFKGQRGLMEKDLHGIHKLLESLKDKIQNILRTEQNPDGLLCQQPMEYYECLEIAGFAKLQSLFGLDEARLNMRIAKARREAAEMSDKLTSFINN